MRNNGLSMRKLAHKIGCHYQLIYMSAHGMYFSIPPIVLAWVVDSGDASESDIKQKYRMFQCEVRADSAERHSLGKLSINSLGVPGDNPIRSLRSYLGLSQSGFCKDLCLPVTMVYRAERETSLPPKIMDVLEEVCVPDHVLQEIVARYEVLT